MIGFLSIAALILTGLAGYAGYLWWQVFRQQQQRREQAEKAERQRQEAESTARKNIKLMLEVLDQGQVSLTEGAIRVMAFVPALPEDERLSPRYQPFRQLAEAAAHIPILDAWRDLSRAQQDRFDGERAQLEAQHRDALLIATRAMLKKEQHAHTIN